MLERDVALKVLADEYRSSARSEFRARFFREARAAGRLNHPNIVTIYDIGESEARHISRWNFSPASISRKPSNRAR